MAHPTKPTKAPVRTEAPAVKNLDSAPFIYFDLVPAYGTLSGTVQIELAARTLAPVPDGGVCIEFVTTARLRCSPATAKHLRNLIDEALKMLEQPQQQASVAAGKLN